MVWVNACIGLITLSFGRTNERPSKKKVKKKYKKKMKRVETSLRVAVLSPFHFENDENDMNCVCFQMKWNEMKIKMRQPNNETTEKWSRKPWPRHAEWKWHFPFEWTCHGIAVLLLVCVSKVAKNLRLWISSCLLFFYLLIGKIGQTMHAHIGIRHSQSQRAPYIIECNLFIGLVSFVLKAIHEFLNTDN